MKATAVGVSMSLDAAADSTTGSGAGPLPGDTLKPGPRAPQGSSGRHTKARLGVRRNFP